MPYSADELKISRNAFYLGIFGNIGLFILKLCFGIFGKSIALINDACHSFSDLLATSVALLGFRISLRPKDISHHYGHYKAEPLVGLFVALTLVAIGVITGYRAILSIIKGPVAPKSIAAVAALISILGKELMAKYCFRVGKLLNSTSIMATAYDHRSDALSSIPVFLAIICARVGFKFLDPLAGFFVSCTICYFAYKVGRDNIGMLMDQAPDKKFLDKIKEEISKVDGVLGMHKVRVRQLGRGTSIDLHIEVDSKSSVIEGDKIANAVREQLENLEEVDSALVHICPHTSDGNNE